MYLILYLVAINLFGFYQMYLDKQKARKGDWRIPEKGLWFIALIGGSIGSTIGMKKFRHKTKHIQFKIGLPLLVIIQVFIICKLVFF